MLWCIIMTMEFLTKYLRAERRLKEREAELKIQEKENRQREIKQQEQSDRTTENNQ